MRESLQTGCLVLGILCLFYFILIVCYAGLSEWFMWIWALAGSVFLIQWRLLRYLSFHPGSRISSVTSFVFVLMLAAILLILYGGSKVAGGMTEKPEQGLKYVIVLGARVRKDQPTRALRKRLDRALEYAADNPETIFILSGGQGPDEGISEALCMYRYMEAKGIDSSRLRIEDKSTSTRENLRFSAGFLEKEKDMVGIISNNFHIYRAKRLAEQEGYLYINGIPAPSDFWMQPHYVLREVAALLKERLII